MRQVGRVAIRLFRGRGNVTCPSSLSRPFESKDAIIIGASYFFHGIKISYLLRVKMYVGNLYFYQNWKLLIS